MSELSPPVTSGKDPELGELLRLMHMVDVERQKRDLALEELSTTDQKARIRDELAKVYRAEGATVSEAEINAAIEAQYAQRYSFSPPPRNMSYQLALLYTRRGWIATRIIFPLLLCGAVLFGVNRHMAHKAEAIRKEAAAEVQRAVDTFKQAVHDASARTLSLSNQFIKASAVAAPKRLIDQGQSQISRAAERLREVEERAAAYARPVEVATYHTSRQRLESDSGTLKALRAENGAVEETVKQIQRLTDARTELEEAVRAFRDASPAPGMLAKGEAQYQSGLTQVNSGNELLALQEAKALRDMAKSLRSSADYVQTASNLVASIERIAKEPAAVEQARTLATELANARTLGDFVKAGKTLSDLRELKDELDSAYILRIVDRSGAKSGVTRTARNQSKANYYYVIVEAVTPDNRVLSRTIVNEETQKSERISVWGERVPKELYDQVKEEKTKRGRVENKILLSKERGYLQFKAGRLGERTAQITRWD
jgi:hypothetical protein